MERDHRFDAIFYELCSYFDFDKVYKTMKGLGWTWFDSDDIPTEDMMRDQVRRLLKCVYDKIVGDDDRYSCSSGGFEIKKYRDANNDVIYELQFIVESSTIVREDE